MAARLVAGNYKSGTIPAELRIDSVYRNTNNWKHPDDVFNRFFRFADSQGIGNVAGFRPKKKMKGSADIRDAAFVVIVTTFREPGWPDHLDLETGLFTYFGDNKKAGHSLTDTPVGGNKFLENIYEHLHSGRREAVPPVLAFESTDLDAGNHMRFLGLMSPGADGMSALEDLVSVWRVAGERFQNYRAKFTVLAEETIPRAWLEDLSWGFPPLNPVTAHDCGERGSKKAPTRPFAASSSSDPAVQRNSYQPRQRSGPSCGPSTRG